jgi:hypothetical protein
MAADQLSSAECLELGSLPEFVDCRRVRLYRRNEGAAGSLRRLVLWVSRNRAVAIGNHVFLPDRSAGDLALLAHELTHCAQYQTWGPARYFARAAAAQLQDLLYRTMRIGMSSYSYQCVPGKPFEAYGIEQQGQIVEDCFRGDSAARSLSPFQPGRQRAI